MGLAKPVLVIGAIVLLIALLGGIVYLPELAIDPRGLSAADKIKAVQDLRGTLLQVLGGAAVLATLYFTAQSVRLNRRSSVTDRFYKAIEQLGRENPDVLIGAVYSLEQIAFDAEELRWPIIEVLTAHLRVYRGRSSGMAASPEEQVKWLPLAQTMASVIGRIPHEHGRSGQHIDLREVNLQGVHLENTNLQGADLRWADLRGAYLARANLDYAHMEGAQLEGAILTGANLKETFLFKGQLDGVPTDDVDLTKVAWQSPKARDFDESGV